MEKKLEQEEINLLLGKGYTFDTFFMGKKYIWKIGKMTLGKLIKLSDIFVKMRIDEASLTSEDLAVSIPAQYQAIKDNAKLCIEAIYIAIESELPRWMLRCKLIMKPVIKRHLLNNFTSSELLKFAMELLKCSNYQNFMTSMALMNGNRPTKAKPIE